MRTQLPYISIKTRLNKVVNKHILETDASTPLDWL